MALALDGDGPKASEGGFKTRAKQQEVMEAPSAMSKDIPANEATLRGSARNRSSNWRIR